MEEKVLIKGVFGGKFIITILWILGITFFALCCIGGIIDNDAEIIIIGMVGGIPLIFFATILTVLLKKCELIVTNKRVIARGAFGYRTDLPIEKITNISMRYFGGIGCGSPSTKVRFHFCKNKQEIFDTIASETLKRDSAFLG
ncbi:MAG: hypothetical protein E7537_02550 [Ruminococcaceae bacterium]|nr:hypothetical protein [Oscillospiraceae bacterium]